MFTDFSHKAGRGKDVLLFEYNKSRFRMSNELHCLDQTIIKRQQELHEIDEVLQKTKTDLSAVQTEVIFLTDIILFVIYSFLMFFLWISLADVFLYLCTLCYLLGALWQ